MSPEKPPAAARYEQSTLNGAMPLTLDAPVLQVDANVIHKVDTSNPQNLFSMWTGEFFPPPLCPAAAG